MSVSMKAAIIFLALVAVGYSAPQQRKLFHEHYEDFANLIVEEVGDEIYIILGQYLQFEEFRAVLNYQTSPEFKNLVYEMEDIPEFKAVVEYMESHGIDIEYYINAINNFVDNAPTKNLRNQISGRDATAYIRDRMAIFPKEKLTALYEKKVAEDEEFKRAMESFDTEEWDELYSALWQNETFLKEVAELKEKGLEVEIMIDEYKAIMGKN